MKPAAKLTLGEVSLICLDTRYPALAVAAMQRCLDQALFAEAVLLTHAGFTCCDPRIQIRSVPVLRSAADYSRFMIRDLSAHVRGSHALIMQWDSFVLDASAWDPAFLAWDYIGAPWPHRQHPVGNGGFSLRSRRLLEALQAPEIVEVHPEDYWICDGYHDLLVSRGVRFAPLALASRFAFELSPPTGPTFGFHGLFNLHRALDDVELIAFVDQLQPSMLHSVQARRLLKNLIAAGRLHAARHLLTLRGVRDWRERLDWGKFQLRIFWRQIGKSRTVS